MNNETPDSLKFAGINLENYKNISKRIVDIGGRSILVMGPNGSGKSSFIQALCSPLDSKVIPTEPIKKGEERSKIEVELVGVMGGLPVKYTLELYFSLGNKKGRLVVLNAQGETIKAPATFVKGLIGNATFDPLKWLNESNEKRLKMFKQLTGCEIEIDKLNKIISDFKTSKKFKKERAEDLESVLKNHGYTQEEIEKYSKPDPIAPWQEQLANISKAITTYTSIEDQVKGFKVGITSKDTEIVSIRGDVEIAKSASEDEVKRLEALIQKEKDKLEAIISDKANKITACFEDIKKFKENIRKGEEWLTAKGDKPTAEKINDRINTAIAHNEHFAIVEKHSEQQREMLKSKQEIAKIDSDIEAIEKERADLISKSQLPIAGLSFTEDQIFIDGLPLETGQQNTQNLIDISVEVAVALNPTLKCVFLHEASLYDKKHLRAIFQKIESKGYMAVAEYVTDTEGLDIKFSETEFV